MKLLSFSRYVESLTVWRGRALGAAMVWLACVFIAGGRVDLLNTMLEWGVVFAGLAQLVGSGLDAVLIAELVRVLLPSGTGWNDRKHFLIVGSLWTVLMIISVTVLSVISGQKG